MKFIVYSRYQNTRYDVCHISDEDKDRYYVDWYISTIKDSWYTTTRHDSLSIADHENNEDNFNIPDWALQNFIKCLFDGDSDV